MTADDSFSKFIAVTMLELTDGRADHRDYSHESAKKSASERLKAYNYSLDAFAKDVSQKIRTRLQEVVDGKNEKANETMNEIESSKDEDSMSDFGEFLFDIFTTTSEFYEINSLHGDYRSPILDEFLELVKKEFPVLKKYLYEPQVKPEVQAEHGNNQTCLHVQPFGSELYKDEKYGFILKIVADGIVCVGIYDSTTNKVVPLNPDQETHVKQLGAKLQ